MSEMTSGLVERIEAATGPNCDIDAEIAQLQGFRIVEEGHPLGRRCYGKDHRQTAVPAYTQSLDASMTLVPEGWAVDLSLPGAFDGAPHAKLMSLERNPYGLGEPITGEAATPALALCAAALRARATRPT